MVLAQIQMRRGTAAQWTSDNPVLASGEWGFEQDTGFVKVGDGATAWNVLGYFADISSVETDVNNLIAALGVYADYGASIGGVTATIQDARYTQIGKRVSGYVRFTLTAAPTSFVTVTLPGTARDDYNRLVIGVCSIKDASNSGYVGVGSAIIDTDDDLVFITHDGFGSGGQYMREAQGWVSGDSVSVSFDYEAA